MDRPYGKIPDLQRKEQTFATTVAKAYNEDQQKEAAAIIAFEMAMVNAFASGSWR